VDHPITFPLQFAHGSSTGASQSPQVSVIICTRNRADSLRVTLQALAAADRRGIRVEVVVVDNAGNDSARQVVESFASQFSVRYLYQPVTGIFGKSHALNCALDAGGLGALIVILDDDISVDPDWFLQLAAISARWPQMDIFTGTTYVVWPAGPVPAWASPPRIQTLILSAACFGPTDTELQGGQWCVGGHFWFRSRVLQHRPRFPDCWATEPVFQLDLAELGFRSVACPQARAGHRVQHALLDRRAALERARKTGRDVAWVRLQPFRTRVKQARMLRDHPWFGRLFCLVNYLRWRASSLLSIFYPSGSARFERRLLAAERMTMYLELYRAASTLPEYSLRARRPTAHPRGSSPASSKA